MKTVNNIYEKIIDKQNILNAIYKSSKGKRKRSAVRRVLANPVFFADKIQKMLVNQSYRHCKPVESVVIEGANRKERKITTIKYFPDQIIHWCLMLQLQPIIIKSAYSFSCGSMPGRGVHYAKKYIEKWVRADKKHTKYIAKMDIKQFYPSVDRQTVKDVLRTKIRDKRALWLTDLIIDSHDKGLPIGYLTSQWFSNLLLQKIDYSIKQKMGAKYYVRYMDDMVVFGNNKKKLHRLVDSVKSELKSLSLCLKSNYQVFRLDCRDLDFLGFRFFRNKTILRKSLMLRITAKSRKIKSSKVVFAKDAAAMMSYMGWLKHSHSHNLYRTRIANNSNVKQMKFIIRASGKHSLLETRGKINEIF